MVTIVKYQQNDDINENGDILVNSISTYILSRKKIRENLKSKNNLKVIVSKKYANYYLDFEENKNVKVEERKKIMMNLTSLSLSKNIIKDLLYVKNKEKEEQNQLKKRYLEFQEDYPSEFLNILEKTSLDEFFEFFLEGLIFSKYKEYNFNILMENNPLKNFYKFFQNKIFEQTFIENYNLLLGIIEKINAKLKRTEKKLQMFNEFQVDKFLGNISGYLNFEKEFYIKNVLEELNLRVNYREIKGYIELLTEKFQGNYEDILVFLEELKEAKELHGKSLENIEEWIKYYRDIYVKYNGEFYRETIEEKIKSIEKKYGANLNYLKESYKKIYLDMNEKFQNYYFENYGNIYNISNKRCLDSLLIESKKYIEKKKTLYLFIDCLRYDLWLNIKNDLKVKGFHCQNDDMAISGIPTVTKYCKKMLYSGKKYNQELNRDNQKNFIEVFQNRNIKEIKNIDELGDNIEGDIFLYEILDIDKIFHSIKDLDRDYIYLTLKSKLDKIFENITPEKFNLIIMTDHGALKLYNENLKSINFKNGDYEIENHGRYIRIYSNFYNEKKYLETKESFKECKEFYTISREEMLKYSLPLMEGLKENYFFLIYKNGYFPKATGEYNHGGISLEEVMIPFGIFTNEVPKYKDISIEIQENILEANKISDFKILLKNENQLNNVTIFLQFQKYKNTFEQIKGNKIITIPLNLEERDGSLKDNLIIEFEVMGEIKNLKFPVEIQVKENKGKKLSKKLKESRSLL